MLKVPENRSLRSIKCELNPLSKSDGSAILAQGKTIALAALHGPVEAKQQRQLYNRVLFDAVYQSKNWQPSLSDKALETRIAESCEATLYPTVYARCEIALVVQEVQSHGGELACAVNAGCLAIMNAGLEMKCMVAAVCCAIDKEDNLIIDPTDIQCENARAVVTLVFDNVNYSVVTVDMHGICTPDEFQQIREVSLDVAKNQIIPFYKSVVAKYTNCM